MKMDNVLQKTTTIMTDDFLNIRYQIYLKKRKISISSIPEKSHEAPLLSYFRSYRMRKKRKKEVFKYN